MVQISIFFIELSTKSVDRLLYDTQVALTGWRNEIYVSWFTCFSKITLLLGIFNMNSMNLPCLTLVLPGDTSESLNSSLSWKCCLLFIPRHTLVSGYYVIPFGVCPSVRPCSPFPIDNLSIYSRNFFKFCIHIVIGHEWYGIVNGQLFRIGKMVSGLLFLYCSWYLNETSQICCTSKVTYCD